MSEAKIIRFPFGQEADPVPPQLPKKSSKKSEKKKHASGLYRKFFRYKDVYGQPRSMTVYGTTEKEAKDKKKAFLDQVAVGLRMDQQAKTVKAWAQEWLKTKASLRHSTYIGYENSVRILNEALGSRLLNTVLPADLKQILIDRRKMSKSHLRKLANTMKGVFGSAWENRLIAFDPSARLKVSGGTEGTHQPLTKKQKRIIEEVAPSHRAGTLAMLMMWGGLRTGEACAFDGRDGIKDNQLSISKSVEFQGNKSFLVQPKTEAGNRLAPIFPELRTYVEKLKGPALPMQSDPGKLITQSALNRAWNSFIYACEVKMNGCHKRWLPEGKEWQTFDVDRYSLRHEWFTTLYDLGIEEKVAAAWGGHADINVTRKIYQHIRETRKRQAAKRAIAQMAKRQRLILSRKKYTSV